MSDLISRQAAIDALKREQSLVERPITETRWFDLGLRKAQEVLSELPSAQPEIIRCKDCKHFKKPLSPDMWGWCKKVSMDNKATVEDWFCAYGERREE